MQLRFLCLSSCRNCNSNFCEPGNELHQKTAAYIFNKVFCVRAKVCCCLSHGAICQGSATLCCHKEEIIINWFKMYRSFVGLQQWRGFTPNFGIRNQTCQRFPRTRDEDKIQIKESWAPKYLPFLVMTSDCGFIAQSKRRKKASLVRRVPAALVINYSFPPKLHINE